jgi:hypothetical protein
MKAGEREDSAKESARDSVRTQYWGVNPNTQEFNPYSYFVWFVHPISGNLDKKLSQLIAVLKPPARGFSANNGQANKQRKHPKKFLEKTQNLPPPDFPTARHIRIAGYQRRANEWYSLLTSNLCPFRTSISFMVRMS